MSGDAPDALPPDAEVQRVLAELLAQPRYARRKTDDQAWLELLERLGAWLDGFQLWMADLSAAAPLLYWTLLLGLLGVGVALVAHMGLSLRAALRAPEARRVPTGAPANRDLAAEAQALASHGRFLEASRSMHLACLEVLVERGWVDLRRGETNRNLRHKLARAPLPAPQRRALAELLTRLERQVFRDRLEDRSLFEDWRGLHRELRALRG